MDISIQALKISFGHCFMWVLNLILKNYDKMHEIILAMQLVYVDLRCSRAEVCACNHNKLYFIVFHEQLYHLGERKKH